MAEVILTHKDIAGATASWTGAGAKVEIQIDPIEGTTTTTKTTITGAAAVVTPS